jgi:enterochelin esterase-like enzyme
MHSYRFNHFVNVIFLLIAGLSAGCSDEGQLFQKMIPLPTVDNGVTNETRELPIAVYLPPSYASTSKHYPVVYFLPEFETPVEAFLDGSFQGFELLDSMDALIQAGEIREMIVVVLSGDNGLDGSSYADSTIAADWRDRVVKRVVRYVDRNYKTVPYPESRGIAEYSMDGQGVWVDAKRRALTFGTVFAMSYEDDNIRERIEQHALPFFSENLTFQ